MSHVLNPRAELDHKNLECHIMPQADVGKTEFQVSSTNYCFHLQRSFAFLDQ